VFEGERVPAAADLKSRFNDRMDKFAAAKKKVERDIEKLKAETGSKKSHRKTVQQDLAAKEVGDL
jgi:hypothetical protein